MTFTTIINPVTREAARKAIKTKLSTSKKFSTRTPVDFSIDTHGWICAKLQATDSDKMRLVYAKKGHKSGRWEVRIF